MVFFVAFPVTIETGGDAGRMRLISLVLISVVAASSGITCHPVEAAMFMVLLFFDDGGGR